MFQFIENMRRKSEGHKQRFVFVSAITVTLVIAAFWGVSVVYRINNGTLSFDLSAPASGVRGIGKQIEDSWGQFFPSVEPAVTPEEAVATTTLEEAAVSDSEPEVILDEPQTEYYPADIYSN